MAADAEAQADRLVGLAVSALLRAAQLGNHRARHLYLIATARRHPVGSADLAAIAAGELKRSGAGSRTRALGAAEESQQTGGNVTALVADGGESRQAPCGDVKKKCRAVM